MRALIVLALCAATVAAAPRTSNQRIFGGSVTTIQNYPSMVVLLFTFNGVTFNQECGGSILNNRSVLSAAHCSMSLRDVSRWRIRSGSSYASSGGTLHTINRVIDHPNFNPNLGLDSDLTILRASPNFGFSNSVAPASIAGPNYNVGDNQVVWAAGWGTTEFNQRSEQLRHVQVWTISQAACRARYSVGHITDNMLCSGVLDVGGRDQCGGDSGGPLFHNRVVVGVCSWGMGCGEARYPGVNVRVNRFSSWIQNNA